MALKSAKLAYIGAGVGVVIGLGVIVITSLISGGTITQSGEKDWLSFFSLGDGNRYAFFYDVMGAYFLFWGLVGLLGAKRLNTDPRKGFLWLILSATASGIFAFKFPLWGISPVIEIIAMGLAWLELSQSDTDKA